MMMLIALLLVLRINALGYDDGETLLNKVITEYPQLLELNPQQVFDFFSKQRKRITDTNFISLPEASGTQRGQCDHLINKHIDANQARWSYGASNFTSGAMTLVYYFSHTCISCHDIARKINEIYVKWRKRGLNVIGIHSTPKGFMLNDDSELIEFIKELNLNFPILSMGSKPGLQPRNKNGSPAWEKANKIEVLKDSLYAHLFDQLEFAVPIAILYKNCLPIMDKGETSYRIMHLDSSITQAQDLLWKINTYQDDEDQLAQYEQTLRDFGLDEDDTAKAANDDKGSGKADALIEDEVEDTDNSDDDDDDIEEEDEEDEEEEEDSSKRRRRRGAPRVDDSAVNGGGRRRRRRRGRSEL